MLQVCQNNPHHTSLPISSSLQPFMLLPITSFCACASELCVQRKPNQVPNIRNSHECVPLLKWNESHDQPRDVNMAVLACAPKIYQSPTLSMKQMHSIFRNSLCIFTKPLFAIGCCWTQDKRPLEKVCSHFLQLQTYKLDCPVEQKYWWVWQFPLSVLKELEMVCFSRAFSTLTAVCSAWFASHYCYTQSHHSHSHHWLDWFVVGWGIYSVSCFYLKLWLDF